MNASDERTQSLWMNVEVAPDAPRLKGSMRCDTLIVGSGIAGLSSAYELSQAGQSVIVIDRGKIGGGMTSRTTAHLAPICDDAISALISLRGEDTARLLSAKARRPPSIASRRSWKSTASPAISAGWMDFCFLP